METILLMQDTDLKSITTISDNVDVSQLNPFILNSQLMYIRPILGDALYEDILNNIGSGTTKYTDLLQEYIYFALGYYVWYSAVPFLHMKFHKKGILKQTDENAENIGLDEMSVLTKRIESMAIFHLKRLENYLEDNKEDYPLYRSNCEVSRKSSSSIHLPRNRKI